MEIPPIILLRILLLLGQFIAAASFPLEDIPDLGAVEKGIDWLIGIPGAIQHLIPTPDFQGQEQTPEQQDPDELQTNRATLQEQCVSDPRSVANPSSTCKEPTHKVIIYSMDCSATADNSIITQILISFVGLDGSYASLDRLCGVSFWAASLTLQQSERLRKTKGVKGVASDGIVTNVGLRKPQNQHTTVKNDKRKKRNHINKRDVLVSRANEEEDLAFLSTAKHWQMSPNYYYFKNAGRGTMLYHLGFGVEEDNPEFSTNLNIRKWLYGKDAIVYRSDDDKYATGTCGLSKSIGNMLGVANLAWVTEVKVSGSISSFLSGFQEAINDLYLKPPEAVKGWTVLETSLGWEWDDPDIENNEFNRKHLAQILFTLSTEYKVLVVVPAGNYNVDLDGYREISRIPALYSLDKTLSVITVGAVDQKNGRPFMWSNGGTALTISAPGTGRCSRHGGVSDVDEGTNIASSIVAGLALYFLSLDDTGPKIRGVTDMPQALIRYILDKAYERPGTTVKSVSNGLNPNDPENYGWFP